MQTEENIYRSLENYQHFEAETKARNIQSLTNTVGDNKQSRKVYSPVPEENKGSSTKKTVSLATAIIIGVLLFAIGAVIMGIYEESKINKLNSQIVESQMEIHRLNQTIAEQEATISELEQKNHNLEQKINTISDNNIPEEEIFGQEDNNVPGQYVPDEWFRLFGEMFGYDFEGFENFFNTPGGGFSIPPETVPQNPSQNTPDGENNGAL